MVICTPNMKSCKPKKRCLFGPNLGKAYDPANPCCGIGKFDETTCDCGYGPGWSQIYGYWSLWREGTGDWAYLADWIEPDSFGSQGPLLHNIFIPDGYYAYLNYAFFSSMTACAGSGSDLAGVFSWSVIISSNDKQPGEDDDYTRSLCVWPRECGTIQYSDNRSGCISITSSGRIIGGRYEVNEDGTAEQLKFYRLFDNLDPASPYWQDRVDRYGNPEKDLPLVQANTGQVTNESCECENLL